LVGCLRKPLVEAHIRYSHTWQQWLITIVGTATAFLLGYVFVSNHPLDNSWHTGFLRPAVNYACTGHFGPIRLADGAPPDDAAALQPVDAFLEVQTLQLSCASFPRHVVATSVFDGIGTSNSEQPVYLMLSYGLLWRWLGPHWSLTYYVIGAVVAASFLVTYLCACRFMPALLAAAVSLLFVSSPFFIQSAYWSPRDAVKAPFAIGIAALLIGPATSPRRPLRFLAFAGGLGLLIGVGYGYRSDLFMFVVPAGVVLALLGQPNLTGSYSSRTTKALANGALRMTAVGVLFLSFGVGAWLPLLNDSYMYEHNRDAPYHSLAAGLLGVTNDDLFQSHSRDGGMYMFRNEYFNDLSIGVRVLEYAARRYGDYPPWAEGRYWTYAKRYYLDVAGHIPADLISRAIGTFVNLMTIPSSSQTLVNFDLNFPWTTSYSFARNTFFFDFFAKPIERVYQSGRSRPADLMLAINVAVAFVFSCLIASRFGFRSAAATIVVLGFVVMVVSLRFEMRHMFYLYAFPAVAWGSAIWLLVTVFGSLATGAYQRLRGVPSERGRLRNEFKGVAPVAAFAAGLSLSVCAAVYVALAASRAYQADKLNSLIADWLKRERVHVQWDTSETAGGVSLIRVRSPMPTSTAAMRTEKDLPTERIEMGMVAVEFDSGSCGGRLVSVTAVGISNVDPDTAYRLRETFSIQFGKEGNYVAFLPAFFYRLGSINMTFSGIETATENISCIRNVAVIREFRKDDVLFDFFVPDDVEKLAKGDLFQRVTVRRWLTI